MICKSECNSYICRTELVFITSRIGELLLLSVPHMKIILKRKDLKVTKRTALNLHYFNANHVAMLSLRSLKDSVEMWRVLVCGFFVCFVFFFPNDKEKLENTSIRDTHLFFEH